MTSNYWNNTSTQKTSAQTGTRPEFLSARIRTQAYTRTHQRIRTHAHTRKHTHEHTKYSTHARTHTHARARAHVLTHHIHAYTHKHAPTEHSQLNKSKHVCLNIAWGNILLKHAPVLPSGKQPRAIAVKCRALHWPTRFQCVNSEEETNVKKKISPVAASPHALCQQKHAHTYTCIFIEEIKKSIDQNILTPKI